MFRRLSSSLVVLLLVAVATPLWAQISIPTAGAATESFDGIGVAAIATLPANWRVDKIAATAQTVGTWAAAGTATERVDGVSVSTTAANGIYNFGSGTDDIGPDRSIGWISSGSATKSGNLYAFLQNNTASAFTALTISYDVEKYRNGSNAAGFRIQMFYSTDGTAWTSAGAPFLTTFAANADNTGFNPAPGATTNVVSQTLSIPVPVTSTVYLAWSYSVTSGTTTSNAQALAVDNFSITGVAAGPPTPIVSSIVRANPDPTNAASVDYTVTFSEAVTGVDSTDFSVTMVGVSGASVTAVSADTGASRTVTVNTGTGDGTIRLDVIDNDSITNGTPLGGVGAGNGDFTSGELYTIDKTGPVVASIVRANPNPTNAVSVDFTVSFGESVLGLDTTDFALTSGVSGASVTGVAGTGPYTVSVNTGTGDGTIRLDFVDNDSVTDTLGNTTAAGFTGGEAYTIDKTGPTVQSVVRANPSPTSAANVDFTVSFGETVTGIDVTDFTLTTTGVSGASVTGVSGTGPYTVSVNTGTGSGTIRLDVLDDDTILDTIGNPLTGTFTTGEVYTIDKSAPSVLSINRVDTNPSNATDVDFTITFDVAVTGVDASDFALALTGVTGIINTPAGAGTTWNVNVSSVSGNGTLGLNLVDDDSILNGTAIPLGGAGAGNGNFTGEVYSIDQFAPSVQSSVLANANPSNAASVDFTVTFSETVTGVDTPDFVLTVSGVTGASITGVTGSGPYTVSVNTGTGDGTIRLDVLDDNSIDDTAGNNLTAAFVGGETYIVDKTAPTVSSSVRADANPTGAASVDFTVTFSEAVTGVDTSDFTLTTTAVTGASITGVSGSGPTTVTVNTGSGSGTIRLDVLDDNSIIDGAANPLNGAFNTGETYTIEKAPLAPTSLGATPGDNTVGLTWNAPNGALTYNVKRSIVSGSGYVAIATSIAVTTYDDNTAVNGTTYFYVVSATNGQGEGPDSNEVSATPTAPVVPPSVVMSQVYGGGGASSGSPAYTNDYVELFNKGGSTADISGHSVQYGSAAGQFGSSASNIFTFPASTTIAPGKYLLVKLGPVGTAGATFTADITTPNLTMSAASGKIALVTNGVALGCGATATPCALPHANIIDLVAWGAANNAEGGTTVNNGAALNSTNGAVRKFAGCQDTDNNNNDFDVFTTATGLVPRTSASPANICGATNNPPNITAPADPIASVAQDAAPFPVNLTGNDDGGIYTWSATPGAGVQSVSVTGGQSTANVTYTVTLVTGFNGTATFTASLNDGVNAPDTQAVNIQVTGVGGNNTPIINTPADPITTVVQDSPSFTVNLTGTDDGGVYNWSATPGTGVASVNVTGGQGTATVTYTVLLNAGYNGTATFTASLSDNVNPADTQIVNINVTPPIVPANSITISQVYGGGGNTGATFKNDYVELYNPTASPINVGGWTIQYGSTGSTIFSGVQPLGGIIAPGEYFLIALASGGAVGADLPTANISGDINMSATNGKVALATNGDPVAASNCAATLGDPDLVDFIGFGTANCREGSANAPAGSNTLALFRQGNGATDTNQNSTDFFTGTPNPRRTTPIQEVGPSVVNTDPVANASNAPRDGSVIVFFTEPVDVSNGWYDITCVTTGSHNDATMAAGAPDSYVITPNTNFQAGEQCTVTVFKDFVHDTDSDDSNPNTDTLVANVSWTFTVATGTAPAYPASVHLTMGNPSDADDTPNNYLMQKPELAISYNRSRGTPNWVSWHLADEWVGTLTRVDTFRPDPEVPPTWYRVLASDYFSSGFDRGHLTPNADRDKETSIPINQATFLMTNMMPQTPDNNQGPWADMENDLRALLPGNELYIVAGPHGIGGTGSAGFASTIANGNVTVPAQTWKVVLVIPKASGDDVARVTASTRTIAVLLPNIQGIRTDDWRIYLTTVDAVEALTGYDFFENIPDAIEAAIEGGIDGVNPPGAANESVSVSEDAQQAFALDAVSPSNGTLTYTILTDPSNGILSGSGSSRTYTPNLNFNGTDTFTYRVNDGTGDSNIATATITVLEGNDPPTAADDTRSANGVTSLIFNASDLTANDSTGPANEAGQTLTVTSVTATADTHGTVSLNSGQITYTPTIDYSGPASFTYGVCDNGVTSGLTDSLCATATVNVDVSNTPLFPNADLPDTIRACNDTIVEIVARLTGTPPFTVRWADGLVQSNLTSRRAVRNVFVTGDRTYTIDSVTDAFRTSSDMHKRIRVVGAPLPVIDDQTHQLRIGRNQTAVLNVVTTTAALTFDWFEGLVGDTSKPIDVPAASITTLPLQRTTHYWVRLTTNCGSINSEQMTVEVASSKTRSVRH